MSKEKSKKVQCAILLHVICPFGQEIYNNQFKLKDLPAGHANKDRTEAILKAFKNYFEPGSMTHTIYMSSGNTHQNKRSFETFLTEIKSKVQQCNFNDLADILVKDQIVIGIDDDNKRGRLLHECKLHLTTAISMCSVAEQSKQQLHQLMSSASASADVDTVKVKKVEKIDLIVLYLTKKKRAIHVVVESTNLAKNVKRRKVLPVW